MIESNTIQAVKDVPILDVIGNYVVLRRRGANYAGFCPFHDERKPSFTVHPAKNMFKCFGCGAGGDAIKFVMDHERKTFIEAVELIARIADIHIKRTQRTEWTQPKPKRRKPQPATFDTIPISLLDSTTLDITSNSLTAQIADIVGKQVVVDVLQDYWIALEADGFINYPQIDRAGNCRTCKSIQYKDGHRTGRFRWRHNRLKNELPPNFILKQCFTGEHLITTKPVAVVEGQSTMLFMAALGKVAMKYQIQQLKYFSTFTWIATGGVDGIGWKDEQVLKTLAGNDVVLFPDAGFYDTWLADAELMQEHGIKVDVSQLIESKYKCDLVKYNEDLRDWLMLFANEIRELCRQKHLINQILSKDIVSMLSETHTGNDFNKLIMAKIKTEGGEVYDLLFNVDGELILPGEQSETIDKLGTFFNKNFRRATLDNSPCWVHTDNRFIVKNN